MILSTILFSVMVTVFIAYVLFIMIKYGVQKSISESYYALPEKQNFLFVLFTWLFAFPAMILGNSWLMFFAGGGIVFVGANAATRKHPTRAIHLLGAISGMLLGGIAMIIQYHMWYMTAGVLALMPITYFLDKKHFMWWWETLTMIAINITIAISIF